MRRHYSNAVEAWDPWAAANIVTCVPLDGDPPVAAEERQPAPAASPQPAVSLLRTAAESSSVIEQAARPASD